jgi:hypothetical protein
VSNAESPADLAAIHRIMERLGSLLDRMRALAVERAGPCAEDLRKAPVIARRTAGPLPAGTEASGPSR